MSAWVREWVNKLTDALKKALADVAPNSATARALSQTADTMTELQKLWDEALVGAVENKAKSPAVNSEAVQYEVRKINGSKFVWIDADILKNKPQGMTDANYVEQYILNKIANEGNFLAQLPESGAKVYAEEKGRTQQSAHGLADEYVKSKYSQWAASNRSQIFKAKMKAAGVLDELVSIAKNRDWQKTRHTDNKDAPYGTYYYDTIFAFPVRDNANEPANRANAYDCKLVILNASDGKKYLYDIVSIKKNTSSTNDISRWLAQKNRATLSTGVSNTTLPQDMQNVKQYSMRDPAQMAESMSDREVLAQALLTTAQNDAEIEKLTEYQQRIGEYNDKEARLSEVGKQIRELSFKEGPRDKAAIEALQAESAKLKAELNRFDKTLLSLEATAPLKALAERQRQAAVKAARAEKKETLKEYRTRRNESDAVKKYRKRIESTANTMLDWLTKNNDKKHVPEELKGPLVEFLEALDMSSDRSRAGGDQTKKELAYIRKFTRMRNAIESGRITVDGGTLDLGDAVKDAFEKKQSPPLLRKALQTDH